MIGYHTAEENAAWAPLLADGAEPDGVSQDSDATPTSRTYRVLESISQRLGLCDADRAPNNWSLRLLDKLWIDCPCCLGLRFMLVGGLLGWIAGLVGGVVLTTFLLVG